VALKTVVGDVEELYLDTADFLCTAEASTCSHEPSTRHVYLRYQSIALSGSPERIRLVHAWRTSAEIRLSPCAHNNFPYINACSAEEITAVQAVLAGELRAKDAGAYQGHAGRYR
jgi:hypothetical protein